MGKRRSIVMAAGLLAVATLSASCARMHVAGPADKDGKIVETRIQVHYDAEKKDQDMRITFKKVKDNEKDADDKKANGTAFGRCDKPDNELCMQGRPVDVTGRDVIDRNKVTAEDGDRRNSKEFYFVSDASSPGRTCVCYGTKCYCSN